MPTKQVVGRIGEDLAERYLRSQGLEIIGRNYRTKRWGELDIVAKEGGIFVFVEVKTRTNIKYGRPEEAVNYYKLRSLKRACEYYCLAKGNGNAPRRLDVIAILMQPDLRSVQSFKHFKNVPV